MLSMPWMADAARARVVRRNNTLLFLSLLLGPLLLCLAGCVSVTGRDPTLRTPGEIVDDLKLERLATAQIEAADAQLGSSHVNVVSYHGIVLLTGEVENQALRSRAERAIEQIPEIRQVHNEIQVGSATNFVVRANDSWLATKVLSKFTTSDDVGAGRIKVVAEDGVIYLMGVVPREQAHAATELARSVFGVRKVVKVFDYL